MFRTNNQIGELLVPIDAFVQTLCVRPSTLETSNSVTLPLFVTGKYGQKPASATLCLRSVSTSSRGRMTVHQLWMPKIVGATASHQSVPHAKYVKTTNGKFSPMPIT